MLKSKISNYTIGKFVFSVIVLTALLAVALLKISDVIYGISEYSQKLDTISEDYLNKQRERLKNGTYALVEQLNRAYYQDFNAFAANVRQKTLDGVKLARSIRLTESDESALDALKSKLDALSGYLIYSQNENPLLGDALPSQARTSLVSNALNSRDQLVTYKAGERDFIAYATFYEPLDIVIAYHADMSEFKTGFLQRTKEQLKRLAKGDDEYYFLIDTRENRILFENHDELENLKFSALNGKRAEGYEQLAELARGTSHEGFLRFEQLKADGTRALKESFVKDVGNSFGWAVGSGLFLDSVALATSQARQQAFNDLVYNSIIFTVYVLVVLTLLVAAAKYIRDIFEESMDKFSQCLSKDAAQGLIESDHIAFSDLREVAKGINRLIIERDSLREECELNQARLLQYQSSIENGTIVFKFSPSGEIISANNAFCELLGYLKKELIGKKSELFFDTELNLCINEQIEQGIKTKQQWHGIVKTRRKNGEICHVRANITPILQDESVSEYLCICQDITELMRERERLQSHLKDTLTGLPNRQALIDRLNENVRHPIVANFDVCRFKQINEYYGFSMGDQVLKAIAKESERLLTGRNLELFKLTNDGFAILADARRWDVESLAAMCERFIEHFKTCPITIDGNKFYLELVFGVSSEICFFITSEMAKDHAKETKQSLVIFDHKRDTLINNVQLTQSLKRAIEEDRIVLYKQAIVDNATGKTNKYECLIRMIDEERNVVSPINFLGLAKNSNLYQRLTAIVIEKSFKYFSKNNDEFSVNLALEDILSPKFLSLLKENLTKYEGIGHRLTLEIVEDEGIENFEQVNAFIAEVRAFGCKVAIDDFGTGYSNFEYLMKIKADIIKIDGSMIRNIDHDMDSRKVVELMVAFTRHLGVKTVAEYVHSNSVLNTVNAIGIDASQGFYFEKPKPLEA